MEKTPYLGLSVYDLSGADAEADVLDIWTSLVGTGPGSNMRLLDASLQKIGESSSIIPLSAIFASSTGGVDLYTVTEESVAAIKENMLILISFNESNTNSAVQVQINSLPPFWIKRIDKDGNVSDLDVGSIGVNIRYLYQIEPFADEGYRAILIGGETEDYLKNAPEKTTLADADTILLGDSMESYVTKKITFANLVAAAGEKARTEIARRERDPNLPDYGVGGIVLLTAPYSGAAEITLQVEEQLYDAENMSAQPQTAPVGTIIIRKMED